MGFSPDLRDLHREKGRKSHPPRFERRVVGFSILLAAPGLIASVVLIWLEPWPEESKFMLIAALALASLVIGSALHDQIIRPLQTLANVVGALREEDYSFRARLAVPDDALGELSIEVNALADLLARHRTGVIEATALLERVVEEVDIPIFAFDPRESLRLVNSAGERLLEQSSRQALGRDARDLGLEKCLSGENESLVELGLGTNARWFVRRSSFRQEGIPHTLVVLSDVSRALREEERKAWQRLIRVLGHELNNSLAPIKSIAGSLNARLPTSGIEADKQQDFERGLNIIATRAASLSRFLDAYRKLALTPPPSLARCAISTLARRVASLETRVLVEVVPGPDIVFLADVDQLEQMLINLVRNAAESILQAAEANSNANGSKEPDAGREIVLSWKTAEEAIVILIEDAGMGLMNPANVFVPFYTTKPQGSGIGLVLSRQIAEAHGGTLELANRIDRRGCAVRITLPLRTPLASDRRK